MIPIRDTIPSNRLPVVNYLLVAANLGLFSTRFPWGRVSPRSSSGTRWFPPGEDRHLRREKPKALHHKRDVRRQMGAEIEPARSITKGHSRR